MKKVIFSLFILYIYSLNSFAQEVNYTGNQEATTYIYVGSLAKSQETIGGQKLKIDVYGGEYESTSLGQTTYSIGIRNGKNITISRNYGGVNKFKLVVFENGDNYDFVIQNTLRWPSFNINVTYLASNTNVITEKQNVDIVLYNISGKTNVTDEFTQIVMTTTDLYGNFGVGTLTPKAKLDVRGKIIADEVEIKVNKGADFVFFSDYDLKPLSEVESFVKENKHLPDIPSEKEMQDNGLNLNDMQIKLLQKIEELTLYTIQLEKKYNALKEELKQINNK